MMLKELFTADGISVDLTDLLNSGKSFQIFDLFVQCSPFEAVQLDAISQQCLAG
jgi:hypothetical protein